MISCSVCGEQISKDDKYCPSCGAIISTTNLKSESKVANEVVKTTMEKAVSNRKGKIEKVEEQKKLPQSISLTKLLYLFFLLLIVAIVIIISSGIFDSSVSTEPSQVSNTNNPQTGVDMANLEQITSLEETVKKNPNDYQTLLQLAHLLNDSGFKAKAIEKYKAYLKHDPDNADVLVDMGVCYYETGNNNEAISLMEKAIKIQPNHQIAHLNLGIVNMSAGNQSKAIEMWKKAIEINPSNEIGQKAQELLKQH